MRRLSTIADDALLERLHVLMGSHRRVTADLIAHLSEVDARRLHVDKGFSSLFSYCVERLAFSEDEACRRIDAARLARKFPEIYSLLERGSVSLTVLGLLKQHLTDEISASCSPESRGRAFGKPRNGSPDGFLSPTCRRASESCLRAAP